MKILKQLRIWVGLSCTVKAPVAASVGYSGGQHRFGTCLAFILQSVCQDSQTAPCKAGVRGADVNEKKKLTADS